jgi:phage baseplate assembly protein W
MAIDLLTPNTKKLTVYSDFRKDLMMNPLTKDVVARLNEDAVKEALKNLILTNKGERLFQPYLGSDVQKSLFDNMTPATVKMIEQNVRSTINNFEPRVTLIDVQVIADPDNYKVQINISFYVRNVQEPVTVSIFLERVR